MNSDQSIQWIFGLIGLMITGGGIAWAGWVSKSINGLSGEVAGLKAAMAANDHTRDKLWRELIDRFDRSDARLDRIEERLQGIEVAARRGQV